MSSTDDHDESDNMATDEILVAGRPARLGNGR